VAGGEPGVDVRGCGRGRIPEQLRRQPLPLPPGSNLLSRFDFNIASRPHLSSDKVILY
jgi:hypothetical protein